MPTPPCSCHVETIFAYANRLEARLAAAQACVAQRTPNLLAKAFWGKWGNAEEGLRNAEWGIAVGASKRDWSDLLDGEIAVYNAVQNDGSVSIVSSVLSRFLLVNYMFT